jgi:hypothetical protein
VPVSVSTASLVPGERFVSAVTGCDSFHCLGLVATPDTPSVTTLAATSITGTGAVLNGTVNANDNGTTASFDYGTDMTYGTTVAATPLSITGVTSTAVSATLTGLTPGVLYHFRVNGQNSGAIVHGGDQTFTTLAPIASWRFTWFGTTSNSGNAADLADPNENGIPNLVEYALNGDPAGNTTGTSILPQVSPGGTGVLQLNFNRYLDRTDLTLIVQANDALTGTWTNLAQSVNGAAFSVVTTGATVNETVSGNAVAVTVGDLYQMTDPAHPHRFMRLQVTGP